MKEIKELRDAYLCKMSYVDVISCYAVNVIDKQMDLCTLPTGLKHVIPIISFNNEGDIRWFTLVGR